MPIMFVTEVKCCKLRDLRICKCFFQVGLGALSSCI